MSWTDYFPVLTLEQVLHYEASASADERCALENLFAGRSLASKHMGNHLICLTLSPGLPPPSGFLPENWDNPGKSTPAQVLIILQSLARRLASERPEVGLRIYLDPAWSESANELLEMGCEVVLMAQPSGGPNPAGLWRFLALEEERTATFLSLVDLGQADVFIERSAALRSTGMKMWRSPLDRRLNYRPIDPDRFGSIEARPLRDLLYAFTWYAKQAKEAQKSPSLEREATVRPLRAKADEQEADWADPDLAGFFLMSAIYPRAASDGMLSLIEADHQHSSWHLLDIEYATWSNANSELLFVNPVRRFLPAKPVDFKESTLVPSMFERLALENDYPEHFEAWQQARVPGTGASEPETIADGESSTKETP